MSAAAFIVMVLTGWIVLMLGLWLVHWWQS